MFDSHTRRVWESSAVVVIMIIAIIVCVLSAHFPFMPLHKVLYHES